MRVPTLDLATAAPAPVAGAQVVETRPDYTSADMLAQSGAVATKALQAAEEAAKDAKRIRETQALAEYHSAANTLNYGTSDEAEAKRFGVQVNSGFLQTQGEEAPAQSAAHLAKLAKYRDDIANRFDAADREALLAKLEPIHQDASLTTERHVGQQIAVVHRNASTTLQAEVLRGIANEPMSPTAWLTLAKTEQQLEELKVPQAEREQFRGLFHATAIDGLVRAGNIDAAETRFEAAKPQLSPQQIDRIDDQLKRARLSATKEEGKREAEQWAQLAIDDARFRVDPLNGTKLEKQPVSWANEALARNALRTIKDPIKRAAALEALNQNLAEDKQARKAAVDRKKDVVRGFDNNGVRPPQALLDQLNDPDEGDPDFIESRATRFRALAKQAKGDKKESQAQKSVDKQAQHLYRAALAENPSMTKEEFLDGFILEHFRRTGADVTVSDTTQAFMQEDSSKARKSAGSAQGMAAGKAAKAFEEEFSKLDVAKTAKKVDEKKLRALVGAALLKYDDKVYANGGKPLSTEDLEKLKAEAVADVVTKPGIFSDTKAPAVTTWPQRREGPEAPPASPPSTLKDQKQKALDWAHAHPADPRSDAILRKLGAK